MWAQKCLKDADVTLAEEEYTDFELRLDGQSFETFSCGMFKLLPL